MRNEYLVEEIDDSVEHPMVFTETLNETSNKGYVYIDSIILNGKVYIIWWKERK